MGFGSYDESEQENQRSESDVDEGDAVSVQDAKNDGDVSYDTDASSDELLDQLQEIKDDQEDS